MVVDVSKVKLTAPQVEFLRTVVRFFLAQGWSLVACFGIVANIFAECSFNQKEVGDRGHAIGICQWQGPRRADFKRIFKKVMTIDTPLDLQLQFIQWELTKGGKQEREAGDALKEAKIARVAGAAFSKHYERPAKLFEEMKARGELAQVFYDLYARDFTNPPPKTAA